MITTDFNGRRIAEGSSIALVRLPWDGPQGTVQEVENGRAWVTFPDAPTLNGWHAGRSLC
jgi:hypothetical protein